MRKLITAFILVLISSGAVFAQSDNKKDATPPNGLNEKQAYYLFYSDYKNKKYKAALQKGRWILISKPNKIEGFSSYDLPTNLDRFITIYTNLAKNSTDPSLKSGYIDTANSIFDYAFKNFSKDDINEYQWHINRGRLYQENEDFVEDAKAKEITEYKKAFELNPEEMAADKGYYLRVLINNLVDEDTDQSKKEARGIIKKVEGNAGEDLSKYLDGVRNKLFDSPKARMAFLEKKMKENPEDAKLIRKLRDIYQDQDMTQKAQALNEKLYKIDPSYDNTSSLANIAIENANYSAAIKYLKEAKTKTDDADKLKSIYLNLSNAYLNKDQLSTARNYAKKAIKEDPNWGRPYLKVAAIYARAVSNCSSGRDINRKDRAVYWLVIDYLNKAKKADSSLRSTVNNRLKSYRPVAPTKEDIFFEDSWSKGKRIRIDSSMGSCYSWINESTTVR